MSFQEFPMSFRKRTPIPIGHRVAQRICTNQKMNWTMRCGLLWPRRLEGPCRRIESNAKRGSTTTSGAWRMNDYVRAGWVRDGTSGYSPVWHRCGSWTTSSCFLQPRGSTIRTLNTTVELHIEKSCDNFGILFDDRNSGSEFLVHVDKVARMKRRERVNQKSVSSARLLWVIRPLEWPGECAQALEESNPTLPVRLGEGNVAGLAGRKSQLRAISTQVAFVNRIHEFLPFRVLRSPPV